MSFQKHLRRVGGPVLTTLAGLLVFLALIVPEQIFRLPPGNFVLNGLVRIPIEALVAVAVLLVLPQRPRRILATVLGVTLALVTVLKIIDMGFVGVLAREFDPVNDWPLFLDFYRFLSDSVGTAGAVAAAAGAVLLAAALLVLMPLAVRRLTRLIAAHAEPARHTVFAFTSAWVVLAVLGIQIIGGIPVASQSAAETARDAALKVPQDIADRKRFDAEVKVDAFADVPDDQLLTALRGKDVVIGFVESYGRSAVEDPEFNRPVLDQLRAGQAKLAAKGFAARTGWLTSPTFGGGSWLAHSTFMSGLWIDNQQRYRSVVSSDRLSLTRAFNQAGSRVVAVAPGVTFAWPEGAYYGYDHVYDSHGLNYAGPMLSWSTMPDQFAVKRFQDYEYAKKDRGPLLAQITLTSSHTPWTPVPDLLDWDALGDGTVYGPMIEGADSPQKVLSDGPRARQAYAKSISYSIGTLVDWMTEYGDDDLVMVLLGDHQPASLVVGQDASRDVPISIIAKDPKMLKRVNSWAWTDGLTPAPDAPVWPMDQFRDRFLTAYGPAGDPH